MFFTAFAVLGARLRGRATMLKATILWAGRHHATLAEGYRARYCRYAFRVTLRRLGLRGVHFFFITTGLPITILRYFSPIHNTFHCRHYYRRQHTLAHRFALYWLGHLRHCVSLNIPPLSRHCHIRRFFFSSIPSTIAFNQLSSVAIIFHHYWIPSVTNFSHY